MKKILTILVGALICTSVFTSCTKQEKKKTLMVGMVTDAGTIDDKSFNQERFGSYRKVFEARWNDRSGLHKGNYKLV